MIFLIRVLSVIKRLIAAFFVSLILKFGFIVLRVIFYKIIVKIYKAYLSLVKRLEWTGFRNNPLLFLIKQKLLHVTAASLTILLVFSNLNAKAHDSGHVTNIASKTILASLVGSEFGDVEDDQLIEEFFDEGVAISPVQHKYFEDLAVLENKTITNTKVAHEAEEGMDFGAPTSYDGTAVVKPDIASTVKTKRQRTEVVYYTVESGDTMSTIAEKFDLSLSTILWENSLTSRSVIRPGDKLTILPSDGITYSVARGDSLARIASKYSISADDIAKANGLDKTAVLAYGQKLILPGARKISTTVATAQTAAASPSKSGLQVLKDLVTKSPDAKPAEEGKLNWPTDGYRITQYYSWKHLGLDIANKTGTPLYAVDDGVVEYSGWGTGYGYYVLINHGGGVKTRYAHASKLYVKKGDSVSKGETLAAMGSTGWSTGPHIHFEYIVNGVKYNPLNYLR